MKAGFTSFTIIALAGEAMAQDVAPSFQGATLMGSILQMFAALAVVVGLILLFYYASNRWLKGGLTVGSTQKYIRILETRFLAPKKSLLLVEVGGEYILLSSAGEGLQFIKQIDMIEDIEVLDTPVFGKIVPGNLQNKIIDLVARMPKKSASEEPARAVGGKLT